LFTIGIGKGIMQGDIDVVSSPKCGFHFDNYIELVRQFLGEKATKDDQVKTKSA
jgi:hypothetical protein